MGAVKKSSDIEPLLPWKQAIEPFIGLKTEFVKKAMRDQGFPYYKLGKCVFCKRSEIEAWIEERKAQ